MDTIHADIVATIPAVLLLICDHIVITIFGFSFVTRYDKVNRRFGGTYRLHLQGIGNL
jgi:hypothetical protein